MPAFHVHAGRALEKLPWIRGSLERGFHLSRRIMGHWRLSRLEPGQPIRLVLGCSGACPQGWIATDIEVLNLLKSEDWARYFHPASVDALLAEHVWEHLTAEEAAAAAEQCFLYLKPGGRLRVAVPDGCHPDPDYLEQVRPGGSGEGAEDHHILWTHATLAAVFEQAGFTIRLLEYFDEQGQFQQKKWDPVDGFIQRSRTHDARNRHDVLRYTSLILDAVKP